MSRKSTVKDINEEEIVRRLEELSIEQRDLLLALRHRQGVSSKATKTQAKSNHKTNQPTGQETTGLFSVGDRVRIKNKITKQQLGANRARPHRNGWTCASRRSAPDQDHLRHHHQPTRSKSFPTLQLDNDMFQWLQLLCLWSGTILALACPWKQFRDVHSH